MRRARPEASVGDPRGVACVRASSLRCALLAVVLFAALPAQPALASVQRVLVFGDSLSAGYGVPPGRGWVDLLAKRLAGEAVGARVVNASVSGETTQGGVTRLESVLERHAPEVVVLELGGNDALRGLPLERTKANLARMIETSRAAGARVLLLGMQIPPNYGPEYTRAFRELYAELHAETGVAFVPFFLDGVALDPALMQDDGIHPAPAAQPRLLDNVWPVLAPLLAPPGDAQKS